MCKNFARVKLYTSVPNVSIILYYFTIILRLGIYSLYVILTRRNGRNGNFSRANGIVLRIGLRSRIGCNTYEF